MLTDAINIKDAFVINFGLSFEITSFKNYNNEEVLLNCITELQNYFDIDKWQVNQPIVISEVENLIGGVNGVQAIEKITFENNVAFSFLMGLSLAKSLPGKFKLSKNEMWFVGCQSWL